MLARAAVDRPEGVDVPGQAEVGMAEAHDRAAAPGKPAAVAVRLEAADTPAGAAEGEEVEAGVVGAVEGQPHATEQKRRRRRRRRSGRCRPDPGRMKCKNEPYSPRWLVFSLIIMAYVESVFNRDTSCWLLAFSR